RGWGYNTSGQLGDGTNINRISPVQVNSLCTISQGCYANFSLYPDTFILHTYWAVNYSSGASPLHYDWNWGDGSPHDTIAFPSHTYAVGGFYSICLTMTDSTGCLSYYCNTDSLARMDVSNAMVYVNVVSPVGIRGISSEEAFSVYPNPATGEIQIATNRGQAAIEQIEIYDLLGVKVLKYSMQGEYKAVIDIHTLPPGIYFVAAVDGANNSVTKKIVKM
ncbi:MAG: T9SS type A sorting domain-containing protein, partial [Bacteroidia bacterium]|nr:T9SS type A sorting domain-containing protein [Bacteroidia bacterium]